MLKIAQEPHPRIRAIRPDLPAGLDAFFDRALAKDPADRFDERRERRAGAARPERGRTSADRPCT